MQQPKAFIFHCLFNKDTRSHHDTTRWLVKVTVKSQPKHFQNQYLSFMKSDYET